MVVVIAVIGVRVRIAGNDPGVAIEETAAIAGNAVTAANLLQRFAEQFRDDFTALRSNFSLQSPPRCPMHLGERVTEF